MAGSGEFDAANEGQAQEEPLDLSADMSEAASLEGSEAPQEDEAVQEPAPAESRRSRILGGGGAGGGAGGGEGAGGDAAASSSGGSTLFERMASLSRGGASSDESEDEDDEDDGQSLSIPRFLGRQNNQ